MGKVQSSDHRNSSGTNTNSRKETKTKVNDRIFWTSLKKGGEKKIIGKNTKHCVRKFKEKCDETRSGSMKSAETSNYTTKVLSRPCTKTLKKSLK